MNYNIDCTLCGYSNLIDADDGFPQVIDCVHCDVALSISVTRLEKPESWKATCFQCDHTEIIERGELQKTVPPFRPGCSQCGCRAVGLEVHE